MSVSMQTRCEEGFGNYRSAIRGPGKPLKNQWLEVVASVARRRWPVKTAEFLAAAGGLTKRGAELILAGRTQPNGDTLAALLGSEIGFEILDGLMRLDGRAAPAWWADVAAGMRLVRLERQAAATRREIESLRRQIDGTGPERR